MNGDKMIVNGIYTMLAGVSLVYLSSIEISNYILIPIASLIIGVSVSLIKNTLKND